jgi:hypothetical protein
VPALDTRRAQSKEGKPQFNPVPVTLR